jgi:hypothetical protein
LRPLPLVVADADPRVIWTDVRRHLFWRQIHSLRVPGPPVRSPPRLRETDYLFCRNRGGTEAHPVSEESLQQKRDSHEDTANRLDREGQLNAVLEPWSRLTVHRNAASCYKSHGRERCGWK